MKKILLTLISIISFGIVYGQTLPQKVGIDNQIVVHEGYTLSYNETCEQANWVTYMITKTGLSQEKVKRKNNFRSDKYVLTGSASPKDYVKSGYDRGHLAPAASFTHDETLMSESFYMSNMSPQAPGFNRGIWKKLESYERKLALEKDTVYVITGGILNDSLKTIGGNEVCVPELYFKVIYNKNFVIAFLLPNSPSKSPLTMYKQSVDTIEAVTGLKFFIN